MDDKTASAIVSAVIVAFGFVLTVCHWRIDVIDLYCKRCGARLIKTEYKEVGKHGRGESKGQV